jgi:hypothetical protein
VRIGNATLHTQTGFFGTTDAEKGFITNGKALSSELKFLGTEPQFELSDKSFKITFAVSLVRKVDDEDKFEPMGHVIVTGSFDPQKESPVNRIHYKEVFETSGGMEYDMFVPGTEVSGRNVEDSSPQNASRASAVDEKAMVEQEKARAAAEAKAAAEEKAAKEAAEKAAAQAAIAAAEAEKKDEAAWARTTENLVHIGKLATRASFLHQTLPKSLAEVLGAESLVDDGEDYQQLFPMTEIRGSKPFRFRDGKIISIDFDLEVLEGISVKAGAIKEANAIKVLNAPKVLAQAMEAKAQALEAQRQIKIASVEANLKIISKEALAFYFHHRTMPKTLDEAIGSVSIKDDGEDYQQLFPMPPVAGDRTFKFRDGSEIPLEINFESFEGISVKDGMGK